MSLVLKDRVRETATVVGTGDAALLGAVTGFQSFSVVGNANTCYYAIADQSGGDWEVGVGTYSTTGPTLARTTVLASSNGNAKVNFTGGTKDIFLTYPSEKAVYLDASDVLNVVTIDTTNIEVTNIKAKDGTASITLADSTGVATFSANPIFNAATANGVVYANGSKVLTTGSALTFDGSSLNVGGSGGGNTLNLWGTSGVGVRLANTTSGNSAYIVNVADVVTNAANGGTGAGHMWAIDGAETMRLTSTGLGIGTSSPSARLSLAIPTATNTNTQVITATDNTYCDFNVYLDRQTTLANSVCRINTASGNIAFATSGSEKMRIDSSGNLGLGVTPSAWSPRALQVGSWGGIQDMNGIANQIAFRGNIYYNSGDKFLQASGYGQTIALDAQEGILFYSTTNQSSGVGSSTSMSERMRIDSSGNVGIGTSSPSSFLADANKLVVGTGSGSNGLSIYSGASNKGRIAFADGTTGGDPYAGLIDYDHSVNAMLFSTNGGSERMRITSGGEVYIAGTTDQGAYNLQCNGTGVWGAGAYVNGSDAALKENVQDIPEALDVVKAIRPVTFTYKEDYSKDRAVQTGFIAQELQQALADQPYLDGIVQAGPEYLNVAYQNLIPLLVKAVQELTARVAQLEGN